MALHEAKIIWHDLIEDPTDLPKTGYWGYLITVCNKYGSTFLVDEIVLYNIREGRWYIERGCSFNGDLEEETIAETVVAWAEIPDNYLSPVLRKHTVFISVPMNGVPGEVVEDTIEKAKSAYLKQSGLSAGSVAFVTNYEAALEHSEEINRLGNRCDESLWLLGEALKKLSKCDEAFFYGLWNHSKDCLVEFNVCYKYKIPVRLSRPTRLISEESPEMYNNVDCRR